MIGIINTVTGTLTNVVASAEEAARFDLSGASLLTLPADYDPVAVNYDIVGGVAVPTMRRDPISLFQFLSLWTPAETLAVINTSDANMAYYWVRAQASPLLHLDNPLVLAGVDQAQAAGIIDAARAAQILAGQPPA